MGSLYSEFYDAPLPPKKERPAFYVIFAGGVLVALYVGSWVAYWCARAYVFLYEKAADAVPSIFRTW